GGRAPRPAFPRRARSADGSPTARLPPPSHPRAEPGAVDGHAGAPRPAVLLRADAGAPLDDPRRRASQTGSPTAGRSEPGRSVARARGGAHAGLPGVPNDYLLLVSGCARPSISTST